MVSSEWEGETSTCWLMCDPRGVASPAIGVGWVVKGLVSDSDAVIWIGWDGVGSELSSSVMVWKVRS